MTSLQCTWSLHFNDLFNPRTTKLNEFNYVHVIFTTLMTTLCIYHCDCLPDMREIFATINQSFQLMMNRLKCPFIYVLRIQGNLHTNICIRYSNTSCYYCKTHRVALFTLVKASQYFFFKLQ